MSSRQAQRDGIRQVRLERIRSTYRVVDVFTGEEVPADVRDRLIREHCCRTGCYVPGWVVDETGAYRFEPKGRPR